MRKELLLKIFNIAVYIFAVIGFVLVTGFFAVSLGLTKTKGVIDIQSEEFRKLGEDSTETGTWGQGEEWQNFSAAITKDKNVINAAAKKADISPRLIMSIVAVEQLRLYYTERQTFKELFKPLKILGTQTQFSWGIAGIKESTAIEIENYLRDKNSVYYPGDKYQSLLDFNTNDVSQERFFRLTDYRDRSYQYLYVALFLKEIIAGWQNAGFDLGDRPEILATLFNIGFANSRPNADPKIGGAEIAIQDHTYNFGRLAGEIYYSDELIDAFPH